MSISEFDLPSAISGGRMVTRSGERAELLAVYANRFAPLLINVGGECHYYFIDGSRSRDRKSDYDLFMSSEDQS